MDLLQLGSCALAGTGLFCACYVACGADKRPGLGMRLHQDPLDRAVELAMAAAPIRDMVQRATAARRRAEGLRQMPIMLDVVTLGLTAGLSFDSALELYCNRYHNELAKALSTAMLSWRLGTATRDEALRAVAAQLDIASLDRFASVVSQALAFGSPLAATLEQQAQAIRDEQRAQMEEEIERVPVKMLIPLGTLIVPAMLLAILGPLLGASVALG